MSLRIAGVPATVDRRRSAVVVASRRGSMANKGASWLVCFSDKINCDPMER